MAITAIDCLPQVGNRLSTSHTCPGLQLGWTADVKAPAMEFKPHPGAFWEHDTAKAPQVVWSASSVFPEPHEREPSPAHNLYSDMGSEQG